MYNDMYELEAQEDFYYQLNRSESIESSLMYLQANKKQVLLSHQCMTENGFEESDKFIIVDTLDFQQVVVENQYKQQFTINPNQIRLDGKLTDEDVNFVLIVGEDSGTFINADDGYSAFININSLEVRTGSTWTSLTTSFLNFVNG